MLKKTTRNEPRGRKHNIGGNPAAKSIMGCHMKDEHQPNDVNHQISGMRTSINTTKNKLNLSPVQLNGYIKSGTTMKYSV